MAKRKPSKASQEMQDSATRGIGLGRLLDVFRAKKGDKSDVAKRKKNAKGIQTATEAEKKRVRHRLELKYPKTYKGGGRG